MNSTTLQRGILLDAGKLRGLRRERGWTQAHLADAAEVSDDAVSRAERGIAISLENATAIAAAFASDLATLAEAKPPGATAQAPGVAVSNIPIRVPEFFLGRDDALAEIAAALEKHQGRVAITALHGLRGVGKTVLAAGYADRHATDYRATWWIRAETEATTRADLVGLDVRLGWVDPEAKEEPAVTEVIQRLAHDGGGILLIYDNAMSADAIRPYLPRGGSARALITSNAHVWRSVAAPIRIGVWPEDIGAEFLIARTGRTSDREAALELSELLGGLPLAHEQAAAYCERLEISLADYIRRFKDEPARLLDAERDASADYHDRTTVAKTFALAIEAVGKLDPAAEMLIVLCSLLAREPIPLFLFTETLGEPGAPFEGDGLHEAIAALRAFALADREAIPDERDPTFTTDTVRLHRLVREVAAAGCRDSDQCRVVLIAAMNLAYPHEVYDDPTTWLRSRRLDALALELVGDLEAIPSAASLQAADLLDRLATYKRGPIADYAQARRLYELALAVREKVLGADDPQTAGSLSNLAGLVRAQGDVAGARPLYERALAITEKTLGFEHAITATALNNLALVMRDQGDHVAAKPLHERALAISEKVLGTEHPKTAQALGNLAGLFHAQGDLPAAQPLYERALAILEKVLGPHHPQIATSLNNLAMVLEEQGYFDVARPLYERALTIDETNYGPDHPEVAIDLNNLAKLIQDQGDLAAARLLMQRALDILAKTLGPDHPNTEIVRGNLAAIEAELAGPSHPPA